MSDNTLSNPSTLIPTNGVSLWVGEFSFEEIGGSELSPPWMLRITARGDRRTFPVASWEQVSPEIIRGEFWSQEPSSDPDTFTIRPTTPRDAERAISLFGSGINYPLPVDVIAYLHSPEGSKMPQLFALSDDDGFVVTLMLSSAPGIYLRYASIWQEMTNPDAIDGLNVNEVSGNAVDLFDEKDAQGVLVHISDMPTPDGVPAPSLTLDTVPTTITPTATEPDENEVQEPAGPEADTEAEPEADEPVVSSGAVDGLPPLTSEDDIPAAIAAATENPEIQWWVERRLKMLGTEVDLPWGETSK